MDMKSGIQKELSRLLTERPALEKEMKTVFAVIDSAPHMTPVIRLEVHELYNKDLALVQADISDMMNQYFKLGGGPDDLL